MLTGMLLGASLVVAALVAWHYLKNAGPTARTAFGVCALTLCVAGGTIKFALDKDSAGNAMVASQDNSDIAWPLLNQSSSRRAAAPIQSSQPLQVPSIATLISGLEQRLEKQPDDVQGWTLLAQSYAFIGRADMADQAVQRAVALGIDASEIRARVDSAKREPQLGSLVGQSSEAP